MAAQIVVLESVVEPFAYYRDNVAKSLELFDELVRLDRYLWSSRLRLRFTPPLTDSRSTRARR
jgi:UDP-glucose 4-epimerase